MQHENIIIYIHIRSFKFILYIFQILKKQALHHIHFTRDLLIVIPNCTVNEPAHSTHKLNKKIPVLRDGVFIFFSLGLLAITSFTILHHGILLGIFDGGREVGVCFCLSVRVCGRASENEEGDGLRALLNYVYVSEKTLPVYMYTQPDRKTCSITSNTEYTDFRQSHTLLFECLCTVRYWQLVHILNLQIQVLPEKGKSV